MANRGNLNNLKIKWTLWFYLNNKLPGAVARNKFGYNFKMTKLCDQLNQNMSQYVFCNATHSFLVPEVVRRKLNMF
jgi:hypothetical protein